MKISSIQKPPKHQGCGRFILRQDNSHFQLKYLFLENFTLTSLSGFIRNLPSKTYLGFGKVHSP